MLQSFVSTRLFLSTCFAVVLGFVPLATVAGPKDGGGGKGIRCLEQGRYRTYLADTFATIRSGAFDEQMRLADPRAVILAAAELVERIRPEKTFVHPYKKEERVSLAWMIEHKHMALAFKYAQTQDGLEDFPDDNIDPKSIPENCQKVQIAIQDLATGVVETDMNLLFSMTMLERGFLELHEVLIALRNRPGEDTTPIRDEVSLVADVLKDRRFSFHELIKGILLPKYIRFDDIAKEASWELFKKCKSTLIDSKPQPGDTEEVALCRRLSAEISAAHDKAYRERALPTLLAIPETLHCRTTYSYKNSFNWRNPGVFRLNRVVGDGTPGTPSVYEIHFSDATRSGKFQSAGLSTARHSRDGGASAHGSLRFSAGWRAGQKRVMALFLHGFSARTKEFYGNINLSKAGGEFDLKNFSSYGVICDGSQARFDIDPGSR